MAWSKYGSQAGRRMGAMLMPSGKQPSRYIYVSRPGGKPLNVGMNQAKRVAHRADKRDRAHVVKVLGSGLPMQAQHHQQLVASRHRYYHEQHEEFLRGRQSAS